MARADKDELGTSVGGGDTSKSPNAGKTAEQVSNEAASRTVSNAREAAVKNPTVENINTFISGLQTKLENLNVASGLNRDGSQPTETRTEKNAANKAAGPSGPAPEGFHWTWMPSVSGGSYKLFKDAVPGGNIFGGAGAAGGETVTAQSVPSTSVDVLKALLKAQGFSNKIIDSSATYLNSLLKDNLDYDNAVDVFLNMKEYTLKNGTKVKSPFYDEYGYLNDDLVTPKSASELFNAVEGYKGLKAKYGFSDKFLSTESLKGYTKNNVTVADLDERANAARLAGITSDTAKTEALMQLGYIADPSGLQDFYMDSKIGKEQLELNRNTGAFVAEAIRRNKTGIMTGGTQIEDFKKIAAGLTAKGYSEAQIAQLASTGFENIAPKVENITALSGIYEKTGGTVESNALIAGQIQSELTSEEFTNMASLRRKKLEEQNARAFQGTSGLYSRLGVSTSLGNVGTTGLV